MLMLSPAYDALRLFQKKFKRVTTIKQIQELATQLHVDFSIEISSATLWALEWSVTTGLISGTFEVHLSPKISAGKETAWIPFVTRTFRVEQAELTLADLHKKVIAECKFLLKQTRRLVV